MPVLSLVRPGGGVGHPAPQPRTSSRRSLDSVGRPASLVHNTHAAATSVPIGVRARAASGPSSRIAAAAASSNFQNGDGMGKKSRSAASLAALASATTDVAPAHQESERAWAQEMPVWLRLQFGERTATTTPTRLDKPCFHVAPPSGWINDPNGPFFYKGRWHVFYQYLPDSAKWDFGLMWGHAVSEDQVHWTHLPPALVPTPGGPDQDGVFSGCACIDEETGVPVLLYTGVRLRSSPTAGPLPPDECDCHQPFIETQIAAWPADLDDPNLTEWVKADAPFLSMPPPNLNLAAWRDPYVISTPSASDDDMYTMIIGAGVRERGGTSLVYKSRHLTRGWEYQGLLANGDGSTGIAWECPVLTELPTTTSAMQLPAPHGVALASMSELRLPQGALLEMPGVPGEAEDRRRYLFSVSPDAPTNPTLYYIGAFCRDANTFDIDNAVGPFPLDMGDILYAPNTCVDPQGRTLLMAWQQERRAAGAHHDYAGCLSLPRVLSVDTASPSGPRLVQQPLPELAALRRAGTAWGCGATALEQARGSKSSMPVYVAADTCFPIPCVSGPFLDIEVSLAPVPRGAAADDDTDAPPAMSGLMVHSWQFDDGGSAALVYTWETRTLEVVFNVVNPLTLEFDFDGPSVRRVGGQLQCPPAPGEPLRLRVLLDASLMEVFTEQGEVLSTRINRGRQPGYDPAAWDPDAATCGVDVISIGGETAILGLAAYEMGSIWESGAVDAKTKESFDELVLSGMTRIAEGA